MPQTKRSVLITGCSDGGTGAALAEVLHNAGLHVYATARNVKKMQRLGSLGIELLELDVLSEQSVAACREKISSLDILINNAGAQYGMPISDMSISKSKELFDVNVWAYIRVTQTFLPLLLESKDGMIVNHTSAVSVMHVPLQATYNASKAAIAMFTDTLRLEMAPFGIKVVDLRSGLINTNLINNNMKGENQRQLPEDSIYAPARDLIEKTLRAEAFDNKGTDPSQWAKAVASALLKTNPPKQVWRGETSSFAWFSTMLPLGIMDGLLKKMIGLDKIAAILQK